MNRNEPTSDDDSTHWAVILSILMLSLVSAWLVFMRGWSVGEAMLTTASIWLGLLSLLLGAMWLLATPEGRDEIWRGFKHTFRDDHDRILKYFRIRRRRK